MTTGQMKLVSSGSLKATYLCDCGYTFRMSKHTTDENAVLVNEHVIAKCPQCGNQHNGLDNEPSPILWRYFATYVMLNEKQAAVASVGRSPFMHDYIVRIAMSLDPDFKHSLIFKEIKREEFERLHLVLNARDTWSEITEALRRTLDDV